MSLVLSLDGRKVLKLFPAKIFIQKEKFTQKQLIYSVFTSMNLAVGNVLTYSFHELIIRL
jgi:hypothetical protein